MSRFMFALFSLVLAVPSCTMRFRAQASLYVRTEPVPVSRDCPPLPTMSEDKPAPSSAGQVWVAGHWRWDGGTSAEAWV